MKLFPCPDAELLLLFPFRADDDDVESVPVPDIADDALCARGGEGETRDEKSSCKCGWSGEKMLSKKSRFSRLEWDIWRRSLAPGETYIVWSGE